VVCYPHHAPGRLFTGTQLAKPPLQLGPVVQKQLSPADFNDYFADSRVKRGFGEYTLVQGRDQLVLQNLV